MTILKGGKMGKRSNNFLRFIEWLKKNQYGRFETTFAGCAISEFANEECLCGSHHYIHQITAFNDVIEVKVKSNSGNTCFNLTPSEVKIYNRIGSSLENCVYTGLDILYELKIEVPSDDK
jgi:hypothetical protein